MNEQEQNKSMFVSGFKSAELLWAAGNTFEEIAGRASEFEAAYAYGMRAAVSAMTGWADEAEQYARNVGMTRDQATAFVAERMGK